MLRYTCISCGTFLFSTTSISGHWHAKCVQTGSRNYNARQVLNLSLTLTLLSFLFSPLPNQSIDKDGARHFHWRLRLMQSLYKMHNFFLTRLLPRDVALLYKQQALEMVHECSSTFQNLRSFGDWFLPFLQACLDTRFWKSMQIVYLHTTCFRLNLAKHNKTNNDRHWMFGKWLEENHCVQFCIETTWCQCPVGFPISMPHVRDEKFETQNQSWPAFTSSDRTSPSRPARKSCQSFLRSSVDCRFCSAAFLWARCWMSARVLHALRGGKDKGRPRLLCRSCSSAASKLSTPFCVSALRGARLMSCNDNHRVTSSCGHVPNLEKRWPWLPNKSTRRKFQ